MTNWIVPANPNLYNVRSAFSELQTLHWNIGKMKSIKDGDHVYIYESHTSKEIIIKATVIKSDVTRNHIDDSKYTLGDKDFSKLGPWMELKIDNELDYDLTLSKLRAHGLKGNIQGIRSMPDGVSSYIDGILDNSNDYRNAFSDTTTTFQDGKITRTYSTKYERNPKNREAAINYLGLNCQVCGFNFSSTYGDIGKDYIEVHHLKPLYTLDTPKTIDPQKDLAVLCANCHKMIHRKISDRNTILSVEELKERLIQNNS